jgi:glycosyltransferase involved in cell wall biosynthesis
VVTKQPKIAFVSLHDPTDLHTWSGIPNLILAHLFAAGANVEIIGPLSRKARYLLSLTWAASKLRKRAYQTEREPLVTSSYARQIERRMRGRHFDAILSVVEPFVISRLNRPEPITYWTDAVWDQMADYYYFNPTISFYSKARLHEQLAMEKAAHAVYSSDWAAGGARKYYHIDGNKLSVIPFGPNLEIKHDRATVGSFIAARRRDSCELLFLGADWERKGGTIAAETTRLLNRQGLKTRLTVAGCKVPGEKHKFIRDLGFISKRTPEGRAQLVQLLQTSNFLVFPTRAECSAIVLSEASAFGLPIITTDTGGLSTYVRQGRNGIRLPLSASAETYAEHIYRLFHDPEAYAAMALSGWEEYDQRLNWRSSVASLLALLQQG